MFYLFIALLFIRLMNVKNALPKDIYQKMFYVDN